MRLLPLFITVGDPGGTTILVTIPQRKPARARFKTLKYVFYGCRRARAIYRLDKRTVPRSLRKGIVENFNLKAGEFYENLSFNNHYLAQCLGCH